MNDLSSIDLALIRLALNEWCKSDLSDITADLYDRITAECFRRESAAS